MRTILLAVVLAAVPAQDAGPEAAVRGFFDSIREAFDSRDGARIADHFDAARLYGAMKQWGDPPPRTPGEEAQAAQTARGALAHRMADYAGVHRFAKLEIRRLDLEADGRVARVVTRETDPFDRVARRRWWLAKDEAGAWKAFDTEDTGRGVRLSLDLAMEMPSLVAKEGSDVARALPALREIQMRLARAESGEGEGILGALSDLPGEGWPPALARFRRRLAAAALAVDGRDEAALRELEPLLTGDDPPILHLLLAVTLNRLGKPARALAHARSCVEESGGDPEGRREMGIALRATGETAKALDAFRAALDEDRDCASALVELMATLPPAGLAEVGERFAKLRDPGFDFEQMAVELLRRDRLDAAAALVAALRKALPEDPNADYYGARVFALRGEHAKAAALLLRAIPRVEDPDERAAYEEGYLDCMLAAGKAVEAYRALPDAEYAFGYLAEALAHDEKGNDLLALANARLSGEPTSAEALYYRGYALELLDLRRAADEVYAQALGVVTDPELREDLRRARVANRYEMGEGLRALLEIPPRRETFRQLAGFYAGDADAVGLAALIKVERKVDPEDPAVFLFGAETLWIHGDYEAMVDMLVAQREVILSDEENRYRYEDRLLRGLLRTGKLDEAAKVAADSGDTWYVALVHAAKGDVEATEKALAGLVEEGYDPAEFHEDEDLAAALAKEAMAPLRERYPPPR